MGLQRHTTYASPKLHVSVRCMYVCMYVYVCRNYFFCTTTVAQYNLLLLFPITSFGWYLLYAV